jgi:SAM-dependent methyltransferase
MRDAGFDSEGLELDPEVAARAARESGVPVRSGGLREQGLPAEALDVVTMYDVVEHLPDPIAELAEARRLLKRDGVLVVETVRVNDNPAFDRDPIRWPDTRPAEHIYLFSEASLAECVRRAGLDAIATERPDLKYGYRTVFYCRRAETSGR